ncbi:transposase [Specibacter cremeus]|uniref:transposase n=1 Tax=Specibacter cremeus TaxID=1629051 RepID=UPI000F770710|nr:transposase [Specibacter cremeus]
MTAVPNTGKSSTNYVDCPYQVRLSASRKYTEKFKGEDVQLVITSGRPIAQVAVDIGVNDGTLGNWCACTGRHVRINSPRPRRPRPLAAMVDTIAISVEPDDPADAPLAHFATTFGTQFNAWYSTAVEWIELWSGQVLTKRYSSANLTTERIWPIDPDQSGLTGWSAAMSVELSTVASILDARSVRSAFERASRDEHPPARVAAVPECDPSARPRQAIIEADTAAEVGMAHLIDERFPALSENAREKIVMKANGVVGLATLLAAIDGSVGSTPSIGRIKSQLAEPRNRACRPQGCRSHASRGQPSA